MHSLNSCDRGQVLYRVLTVSKLEIALEARRTTYHCVQKLGLVLALFSLERTDSEEASLKRVECTLFAHV